MSLANDELHYRGYDAFNRRDLDGFIALADPRHRIHPGQRQVEGGDPSRGYDGARRFWREFFDVFPDVRVEADEI